MVMVDISYVLFLRLQNVVLMTNAIDDDIDVGSPNTLCWLWAVFHDTCIVQCCEVL